MTEPLTLSTAADGMRSSKMPRWLTGLLGSFRRIFSFTHERANRVVRFVAIANAYRRGSPVRDIETKYGCSRNTVLRYARLAGLPKRDRGFEPGIRDAVVALYAEGRPIAEIQARLGVSQAYISKTATEEGINRRRFKNTRASHSNGNRVP